MRDYIVSQLERFLVTNAKPFNLGIVNWGGTFSCLRIQDYLDDTEGILDRSALLDNGVFDVAALTAKAHELTPVQGERELESILLDSLGFRELTEGGLLTMKIIYHKPIDSSQMMDSDREPALVVTSESYRFFDALLGLHGTDTAAKTARFNNMSLPHFNPRAIWEDGTNEQNWTKPYGILASQEPVARFRNGRFEPVVGSDGAMSLVTMMSVLTGDRFGEVGFLVQREQVRRGSVTDKGSESHFDFLHGDKGVPHLAERTAFGLTYPGVPFDERSMFQDRDPFVIHNSSKYEGRVLTVREASHLANIRNYLGALDSGDTPTAGAIRDSLPLVVLYESRGAGLVQAEEFATLEKLMEVTQGEIYVLRVPLPGGRVPRTMHYNAPGGAIRGCNIESVTARYKAQSVLALMNQLGVDQEQRSDFFYQMMDAPFAREQLPMY